MRLVLTLFAALAFFLVAATLPVSAAPVSVLDATLVVKTADDEARFLGSAFLYGDDGVVITNAHVVAGQQVVRLVARNGEVIEASVVARDDLRDIAVLRGNRGLGPGLRPAPAAAIGQEVFAAGAPLGAAFTLTRGIIAATPRQVEAHVPMRLLQHDAAVNPGSSGGPLVDARGRLLGMNSQIADGAPYYVGISYAISVQDIVRLLPAMARGEVSAPPRVGVRVRPVDRRIAAALGLPEPAGVLVDHVDAGSLAEAAGLRSGDIILAFGLVPVDRTGDLAFLFETLEIGQQFPVTVWRTGARAVLSFAVSPPRESVLATVAQQVPAQVAAYDLAGLGVTLGEGGVVRDITLNSPAFFAGLGEGDRIVAVNGVLADAARLAGLRITQPLLLQVARADGSLTHLMLDPWSSGRRLRPAGANVLDPDVVLF